jgi:broad specificity phosphatase PhoE
LDIVVIRHGKSVVDTAGKVNARDFGLCYKEYDEKGVCEAHLPPEEVIDCVAKSNFRVCSNLARSLQSAKLLGIEQPDLVSPLYRECELPYTNWSFPRLSKTTWPVIFRILQLLGYSPNAESYKQVVIRSKACAAQLHELSSEHGSVLYVGHGALIWFLHRHLTRQGWLGPRKSVREHWEYGVYRYREN